jgi:hypothetical protein
MSSASAGASSSSRRRVVVPQRHHTNDAVPIIGCGLVPNQDNMLSNAIHETISQGMNSATRQNYRNRIARIIEHFKEHFPEYYQVGVREVTDEEKADRTKFYFNKTQDLIYTGLNVQFLIFSFLPRQTKRW